MRYETLLSPAELATHIDDADWRIIDCSFTLTAPEAGRQAYLREHIPGAIYAHLDEDLSSAITAYSGRHPLPDKSVLAERFGAWGIDSTTQVVVYDACNGMMATRLWWLLRWLGHCAVALLDGGLPRWQREGYPLSNRIIRPEPRCFTIAPALEECIDSEDLLASLESRHSLLIDVRAPERFRGEVEPLDRVAGHIPGAVNLPLQCNLDNDGNFLPAEQLRARYLPLVQEREAKTITVMCGSGVTACHTLLALRCAGISHVKLYAGSWSEWITEPQRPVATGP